MLEKYLSTFNGCSVMFNSYWVLKNVKIENTIKIEIEIENELAGTLAKSTTLVYIIPAIELSLMLEHFLSRSKHLMAITMCQ